MLPGARERFIEIPQGVEGSLATLERMAGMVREGADDPTVTDFAAKVVDRYPHYAPLDYAALLFEWVRTRMLYLPDYDDGEVIEEIRTPGYLLQEIARYGNAVGDCDDYVVLYGALYRALGFPVRFVAISITPDQLLGHVYLQLHYEGEWITADGIVPDPFGWEVPAEEVTNRVEWPV